MFNKTKITHLFFSQKFKLIFIIAILLVKLLLAAYTPTTISKGLTIIPSIFQQFMRQDSRIVWFEVQALILIVLGLLAKKSFMLLLTYIQRQVANKVITNVSSLANKKLSLSSIKQHNKHERAKIKKKLSAFIKNIGQELEQGTFTFLSAFLMLIIASFLLVVGDYLSAVIALFLAGKTVYFWRAH